jgi:hypothetical protein
LPPADAAIFFSSLAFSTPVTDRDLLSI